MSRAKNVLTGNGAKILWLLLTARRYPGSFAKVKMLKELETKSREEMEAIQFDRLKSLLSHAYGTSPFYRERFDSCGLHPDDIKDWEGFRRIPLLRKHDIQAHRERMVSSSADRRKLIRDATGGSTGEPLIFFRDEDMNDWFVACDIYVNRRWGVSPWCRKAFLWGADRDIPEMTRRERLRMTLERERILNSFNMDPVKMEEYAELLRRWEPEYIQGYASSLWLFADFAAKRGFAVPEPRAVRSSAETLYKDQRAVIEKVFGKNVYDFYGSREVTNIAAECVNHKGLHVFSPIRVVETVDRKGRPVMAGRPGSIVVTDLVNRSMPFIRYDIGDVGVMGEDGCGCGCNFALMKEVLGRQSDLIKTGEGKFIHGEFFTHLFYGVQGVARFQVYQKDLSGIDIRIVATDGFDPGIMAKIRAVVEERMNFTTAVSISLVDEIPGVASGKRRFTISDVSNSFGLHPLSAEGSRG